MNNEKLIVSEDSNKMNHHRQALAEYIFQEDHKEGDQSSSSFYEAVSQELNNISDKGIEILLKQKSNEKYQLE